jgi:hypothetical protein
MILNIWFHWDFGEIYWFCPNKNPVISLVAQIPLRPRWPARCCCLFLTIQWSWQLGWPQGRPGQACRSNIVYEGWNRYETVVFWGNHWIYMGIYICIIYIYDYIWIYRPSEAFWGTDRVVSFRDMLKLSSFDPLDPFPGEIHQVKSKLCQGDHGNGKKNVPNSTAVSVQQTPTVYICMFALAVASMILRDCLEVFPPTI